MAAGLGFKDFTTGEVLTAADVDGYLMQGVWVFASAAARTSAVTSPQEGNVSFLKDTNSLEIYDGAAWVAYGSGDITGVTAGTGISGGGTSGTVTITNSMATEITAAGDIIVGTGNGTFDNLPIGSTGQILTADTTVSPYKVKWAAAAGGLTSGNSYVSTSQSTTSTTYTSLATADSVTLTTGTKALILFTAELWTATASRYAVASVAVSGATTIAASDDYYARIYIQSGGASNRFGIHTVLTGLTAGSNTFSMKYAVLGGAGTTEARYRALTVIDLGS